LLLVFSPKLLCRVKTVVVFIITIILGIAGAFVGGWVGSFLGLGSTGGFSLGSIATATVGALLLLIIYRMVKK
jgi:uncharacterized membrane protein YeaQ/YmgE (transglycosylase-associated protein family)